MQTFVHLPEISARSMQDATTFLTNESDWSTKVNKVRNILVKPGRKSHNSLTATAGKYKKYEKL